MNFVKVIEKLLNDLQGYLLGLIGAVTTIMVAIYAVKFLMGDSSDKSEAVSNIKRTLIMGGGIFVLIWLAGEIISRFQAV